MQNLHINKEMLEKKKRKVEKRGEKEMLTCQLKYM